MSKWTQDWIRGPPCSRRSSTDVARPSNEC